MRSLGLSASGLLDELCEDTRRERGPEVPQQTFLGALFPPALLCPTPYNPPAAHRRRAGQQPSSGLSAGGDDGLKQAQNTKGVLAVPQGLGTRGLCASRRESAGSAVTSAGLHVVTCSSRWRGGSKVWRDDREPVQHPLVGNLCPAVTVSHPG